MVIVRPVGAAAVEGMIRGVRGFCGAGNAAEDSPGPALGHVAVGAAAKPGPTADGNAAENAVFPIIGFGAAPNVVERPVSGAGAAAAAPMPPIDPAGNAESGCPPIDAADRNGAEVSPDPAPIPNGVVCRTH